MDEPLNLMSGGDENAEGTGAGEPDKEPTPPTGEPQAGGEPPKGEEGADYTAFTLPENVKLDDAALAEFSPLAKELGLTQEQAQKMVDLYTKNITGLQGSIDKQAADYLAERESKWSRQIAADKEFGGENLKPVAERVNKLLKEFDTDNQLVKYLEETQAANCAPLFFVLARISKHFEEDDIAGHGGKPTEKELQPYERMGWK